MESNNFTKIIAHRGDSDHFPENTLISLKRASEDGADIIELDIHLSKDGVPVLLHDPELSRTTNGSGNVRERTLKELKELSAGFEKKFGSKFKEEKIPTLREVFENLPKEQDIFVEVKKGALRKKLEESGEFKALSLAREFGRLNSTYFISFEKSVLERLKEESEKTGENIQTGFIASPRSLPDEDPIDAAVKLGASWGIYSKYFRLGDPESKPPLPPNPKFGENKKGLKLAFWTFGEPAIKEALDFADGTDAVATNSPKETKGLLNKP